MKLAVLANVCFVPEADINTAENRIRIFNHCNIIGHTCFKLCPVKSNRFEKYHNIKGSEYLIWCKNTNQGFR